MVFRKAPLIILHFKRDHLYIFYIKDIILSAIAIQRLVYTSPWPAGIRTTSQDFQDCTLTINIIYTDVI